MAVKTNTQARPPADAAEAEKQEPPVPSSGSSTTDVDVEAEALPGTRSPKNADLPQEWVGWRGGMIAAAIILTQGVQVCDASSRFTPYRPRRG